METWIPRTDDFGARLALVRWKMGWNLKEAALACGLSPQSWREWEMQGRAPRNQVEVSEKISERTGVDDYWILTGRDPGGRPDGPNARPSDYKAVVYPLRPAAGAVHLLRSA